MEINKNREYGDTNGKMKPKKICIISFAKDDADVIESFIRYHLTFIDSIVIIDDRSTDATPEIVRSLSLEGLPVELIQVPKDSPVTTIDFVQSIIKSQYMKAFDDNFCWVLPLNLDEFLYCEDGRNPRSELEKLDERVEYRFFWRTGVYSREPDDSNVFLPNYFEEYRDPSLERFTKVILSRHLAKDKGAIFAHGFHLILFPDEKKRAGVPVIHHTLLRVAHFPVRSINHVMTKVIFGQLWIFAFASTNYNPFHWEKIYNTIKSEGVPTTEQVRRFSLEYALTEDQLDVPLDTIKQFRGALRADFLINDIGLSYTNYDNNNYLGPILNYFELLLDNLKAGDSKQM